MSWFNSLVDKLDMIRNSHKDDSVIKVSDFNFKFDQQLKLEFQYQGMIITCNTKIDDVKENLIEVLLPTVDGRPCKLEKDHSLDVTLMDNTGLYIFTSHVVTDTSMNSTCLQISIPTTMQRFEQRRSVRVWASMPVLCSLEGIDVAGLPRDAEVWSKDISINGICFVAEWSLPLDSQMKISFKLPKGAGLVDAEIRIVRCVQDVLPDKYVVGAEFSALSIENRKSIMQFVEMRLKKL